MLPQNFCQMCGSDLNQVLSQNASIDRDTLSSIVKSQKHTSSKRVPESMKLCEDLFESASQTSTHEDPEGINESMETNSFRSPTISRQNTLSRPSSIDECSPVTQYLQCGPPSELHPAYLGRLTTCNHPINSLSCVGEGVEQNHEKKVFKGDMQAADLSSSKMSAVASSSSSVCAKSNLTNVGLSRKDQLMQCSEYVLPIIVQNTFITLEDLSPGLIALRRKQRSRTLPACAPQATCLEESELHEAPKGGYDGELRSFHVSPVKTGATATEASSISFSEEKHHHFGPGHTPQHAEFIGRTGSNSSSSSSSSSSTGTEHLSTDKHTVNYTGEAPGQNITIGRIEGGPGPNFACSHAPSMDKVKPTASHSLVFTQSSKPFQFSVCWTVDAHKVRGNEKQTMSPHFELPLGPTGELIKLRLAVYPKTADPRSAVNFKSSKGKGYVQIKCDSNGYCAAAPMRFTLAVGGGHRTQGIRGPVEHDFAKNSIAGLPRHCDCWDFRAATESRSTMFSIFLEIARVSDGANSSGS